MLSDRVCLHCATLRVHYAILLCLQSQNMTGDRQTKMSSLGGGGAHGGVYSKVLE